MDIPRFFISSSQINKNIFSITNLQDVKKISKVLRLKANDKILLIDENGINYLCAIKNVANSRITGDVIEIDQNKKESNKSYIILAQALTRAGKMKDIIRANVEIGVREIIPFESEYSVFRLKQFKDSKLLHWQKIAKEAARQSEQSTICKIHRAITFNELINKYKADLNLLLVARDGVDIKKIKKKVKPNLKILVVIGPEGGFSKNEIDLARQNEFLITHLDLPILRTQTAGVATNTILLY